VKREPKVSATEEGGVLALAEDLVKVDLLTFDRQKSA
jgi:hypothetical protein